MATGDDHNKRLFEVEVVFRLYVLAEDEGQAGEIAERHVDDEEPGEVCASEVKRVQYLDKGTLESYPWNQEDGDKTIGQLLNDMENEPAAEEPWGVSQQEFAETLEQAALPDSDPRKRD